MKVAFRVDASLQIGVGHLTRCLTLASELRARGSHCRFIVNDYQDSLLNPIYKEGFEVVLLNSNYSQINKEVENSKFLPLDINFMDALKTIGALNNWHPDWLVVDHYFLDKRWESLLRLYCKKIMAIDDLADREHQCDLLLDQNLVKNHLKRYDNLVPEYCGRLLGTQFCLLQPQYKDLHQVVQPRMEPIRNILIFFGGADNENLTGRAISAFLSLNQPDILVDVVINSAHLYLNLIKEQVHGFSNISLHHDLQSLAELILKADLCIGAGGTTSWERCCLGLPALVVVMASNQDDIAKEMHSQGYIYLLGNQHSVSEGRIRNKLLEVLNFSGLHSWSQKCLELLDGKGTLRVADLMFLNQNTELKLRCASWDDQNLLLYWANDVTVRQSSFNSAVVDSNAHYAWCDKRFNSPNQCKIYICEVGDRIPIGVVRFEIHSGKWQIHYSLDVIARNKRLALPMLTLAISTFKRENPTSRLFARVKINNLKSQNIFKKLGFCEVKSEKEFTYFDGI